MNRISHFVTCLEAEIRGETEEIEINRRHYPKDTPPPLRPRTPTHRETNTAPARILRHTQTHTHTREHTRRMMKYLGVLEDDDAKQVYGTRSDGAFIASPMKAIWKLYRSRREDVLLTIL